MNTSSRGGEPQRCFDQGVTAVKVTHAILIGLLAAGLTSCSGSSTSGGGTGSSGGGDNAAKIVGVWQSQKKNEGDVSVEFTKDGKLKFIIRGEAAMEGTYKVSGDQCTLTPAGAETRDGDDSEAHRHRAGAEVRGR
jgi:hypothetical protein